MSLLSTIDKSGHLLEQASHSADQAIRVTQQVATAAVDSLAGLLHELLHQASPMLERAGARVSALAKPGDDSARESAQQLRSMGDHASDTPINYTKDGNVKAVLIAAATGAVLMALASLVARSRDRA